jgi:hypothetical protein
MSTGHAGRLNKARGITWMCSCAEKFRLVEFSLWSHGVTIIESLMRMTNASLSKGDYVEWITMENLSKCKSVDREG